MNIVTGIEPKAQKVVVYGTEGVGKSLMASKFTNALFIDLEGSTSHLDVPRMEKATSFSMLEEQIRWLSQMTHGYNTLVIDTIDWAESLCQKQICQDKKVKSLADFDWGKGYALLADRMAEFLDLLSNLADRGMNIILLSHSHIKAVNLPEETGSYDKYELKMEKKVSSTVREWAYAVFFCHYKTLIIGEDQKKKARGGRRTIQTCHKPSWDAKNRYGLQEDYDYEGKPETLANLIQVHFYFKNQAPKVEAKVEPPKQVEVKNTPTPTPFVQEESSLKKQVSDLLKSVGYTEQDLIVFGNSKGTFSLETKYDNISDKFFNTVIKKWDEVKEAIAKTK